MQLGINFTLDPLEDSEVETLRLDDVNSDETAVSELQDKSTSTYYQSRSEEDQKIVESYVREIETWRSFDTVDNAYLLDASKKKRLKLAGDIVDRGMQGHPELNALREYYGADIAEVQKTDERESDYATVVQERSAIRNQIFGTELHINADLYSEAIETSKGMIMSSSNIDDQYAMLDIRREVVQEHYDDAIFISQVALQDEDSNHLRDELLYDLGYDNSRDNEFSASRTKLSVDTLMGSLENNFIDSSPIADKISAYKELQGMTSSIISNPNAVMLFARATHGLDGSNEVSHRMYGIGINSMQQRPVDSKTFEDFFDSYPDDEKAVLIKDVSKNPAKMFSAARKKFEQELADPTYNSNALSSSFGVMTFCSEIILKRGGKNISDAFQGEDGQVDAEALLQFRSKTLDGNFNIGKEVLEERLKKNTNLRTGSPVVDNRSVDKVVSNDGSLVAFDFSSDSSPEIEIVDGSHITLRSKNDGFLPNPESDHFIEATGLRLDSKKGMKSFLSMTDIQLSEIMSTSEINAGLLKAAGLDENDVKSLKSGSANKAARVEIAMKLGLGQTVFSANGLGPGEFKKLADGSSDVGDFMQAVRDSGLNSSRLETMGLTTEGIQNIASNGDKTDGVLAYQSIVEKSATFRLNGVVTPPKGEMTLDRQLDAGLESKSHLESIVSKDGRFDKSGLELNFQTSGDGKENTISVNLPDGRDLSDIMVQDGYALPLFDEAGSRTEKFAQTAESQKRGLWKHGLEDNKGWRRDMLSPDLSAHDKKERLFKTVGASMAGSPAGCRMLLSDRKTKLFALPLESWVNSSNTVREVSDFTNKNPSKARNIYDSNMEILTDLRAKNKKGSISEEEKLAHDRLSVGRRVLAEAMVINKIMTPEEAKKDSHKLLSKKALLSPAFKEKLVKASEKTFDIAGEGVNAAGRGVSNVTKSAMDFVFQ